MRSRRLWLGLLGATAAVCSLLIGNTLLRHFGWSVPAREPAELSAFLQPHYRVLTPPGSAPFPTALLHSGCDGPKDSMLRWAEALNGAGWAAVIVDGHTPRRLAEGEAWRLVCAGQLFMGSERAGDVLVSLHDAREMDFVDPSRLALIGASHGGWAIMELLALDPPAGLPHNLAAMPQGGGEDGLAGVTAVVLLYPYCGTANRSRPGGWDRPIPTLFLLSVDDTIAPAARCAEIVARMVSRGLPVRSTAFPGVTHGFDQAEHARLSTLVFDERATVEALRLGVEFLAEQAGAARRD